MRYLSILILLVFATGCKTTGSGGAEPKRPSCTELGNCPSDRDKNDDDDGNNSNSSQNENNNTSDLCEADEYEILATDGSDNTCEPKNLFVSCDVQTTSITSLETADGLFVCKPVGSGATAQPENSLDSFLKNSPINIGSLINSGLDLSQIASIVSGLLSSSNGGESPFDLGEITSSLLSMFTNSGSSN